MDAEQRRRRTLVIAVIVLVPLLILAAWGLSLAGSAGFLPWQSRPASRSRPSPIYRVSEQVHLCRRLRAALVAMPEVQKSPLPRATTSHW